MTGYAAINNQGAYAQAKPLFVRALAIFEKALGPDHPVVATSVNNLAGLYQDQGAYAEAEQLFARALAIREKGWMGHKRIEETMLYVHVADVHARELPAEIRDAAIGEADADTRIIRMLGARGTSVPRNEEKAAETKVVTAA